MSELFRALAALAEPPRAEHVRVADALGLGALPAPSDHTAVFDFALYPYASVYLGAEGMLGGEARDRVAAFFRALGAEVPAEPDHLTVLLATYAALAERASSEGDPIRRASLASAKKALFWEHLASFLPAYTTAMRALGVEFYARWAELLAEVVRAEAQALGPPGRLPIHLSESAPLSIEPATTLAELTAMLLAPVRCGMILVRADLLRAARDLGLASRAGERRYLLSALLSQDAAAVLRWLANEAERWAGLHLGGIDSCVSKEWARRANRTARVLSAQADVARERSHVSPG